MTFTSAGQQPRQFWELSPLLTDQVPDNEQLFITRQSEGRHRRQQRRGWAVMFAVAASGSLAVAALVAGQTLLGSSGGNAGPPAHALVLAPSSAPRSTGSPSPTATAVPTRKATPSRAAKRNATQQAIPMRTVAAATVPAPVVASAPTSAASSAAPTARGSQQPVAVTVTYVVVAQTAGSFEAEVNVVNTGTAPISGWQILVALPQDTVTSFSSNASGEVSDKILLLTPAPGAAALAAGGKLRVFFTADGFERTPTLCAFNNVSCG